MSEIEEKMLRILQEKREKVLPENIKKGASIFGVTGTHEGGIITEDEYNNYIELMNMLLNSTDYYRELDYIEFTGTQWINTNYTANHNIKFEITITEPTTPASSAGLVTGTPTWADNAFMLYGGSKYYWAYLGSWSVSSGYPLIASSTKKTTFTCYRQQIKMDDTYLINNTNTRTLGYGFSTIYIGNHQTAGHIWKGKLHSFKLWDSGTLVKDLIPVRIESLDKVCLLDKVTNTFVYNAGTGEFIGGPLKEEMEVD